MEFWSEVWQRQLEVWLCLMLTFSSPGSAIWIRNASRQIDMETKCSVSKLTILTRRDTDLGSRVILVTTNVHPKRFLFSGGFFTFQLNASFREIIKVLIKFFTAPILTTDALLSICSEQCLKMQQVSITNALSYFLIYKLPPTSDLQTGQDRQPQTFVIDIFVLILHYPGKPSCVCVRIQGCNMSIFYGTKYWDQ